MKFILAALLAFLAPATAHAQAITGGQSSFTNPVLVTNGGTGASSFTSGSVVFATAPAGGTVSLGQNNSSFFWDNQRSRFGLGTASPVTLLHLESTKDPVADPSTDGNFNLYLRNTSGSNGTGTGIAFGNSATDNVGAAIIHNRTGSNSQGTLDFYVKQNTGAAGIPDRAVRIDNNMSVNVSSNLVVTATATVLGNAFSVGTASFTIAGGSATVAYGLTATTILGPSALVPVVFSPSLSSATVSGALSGTFTNTALGPCIAGSTQTLTLAQAGDIRFDVHCTISVASLAAVLGAGVIVDGGFIDGESLTLGIVSPLEAVSTDGTNLSFTAYASNLSAGTHNFCFSPFVSTNTGTINSTTSVCHLHAHRVP